MDTFLFVAILFVLFYVVYKVKKLEADLSALQESIQNMFKSPIEIAKEKGIYKGD